MTVPALHTRIVILSIALLMLASCGPKREDTWNSYYYGTERSSSSMHHPIDNDDSYVIPQGSWEDDQTPQGQIW